MAGTHGDLFREIGSIVVAAHDGQAIDLRRTSEDLARRYANLHVPERTIVRALARSMGAVSVSMALIHSSDRGPASQAAPERYRDLEGDLPEADAEADSDPMKAVASLFPSGLRLAVLS